jgi:hypothetical protein
MTIGGRDYTSRLMDNRMQALYVSGTSSVCEVGSIVRDIVWTSPLSGTIGVNNVSGTTKIVTSYRIKNKSMFEAIKQLADYVSYDFWIDYTKDLHFSPEAVIATPYNLNNTNAIAANVQQSAQEMFNQVTVYGDKTYVRWQETFTADGGSIFTLVYNPSSTYVTDSGVKKQGAVYEMTSFMPTGTQYLVDYDTRRIIFVSGTDVGDNVPSSGNVIVIQYDRGVPIVKQASDDESIGLYGLKENVIINTEIKDPRQASDIAKAELARTRNPAVDANISILSPSISGIQPSQTVYITLPNDNISGANFKVFQSDYNINKASLLNNEVISVRAGTRIQDASDLLKKLIIKTKDLQAEMTDVNDVITLYRTATGSVGIKAHWYIRTNSVGSSFILTSPTLGVLGTGLTPQPYLGNSSGSVGIVESGGDFSF